MISYVIYNVFCADTEPLTEKSIIEKEGIISIIIIVLLVISIVLMMTYIDISKIKEKLEIKKFKRQLMSPDKNINPEQPCDVIDLLNFMENSTLNLRKVDKEYLDKVIEYLGKFGHKEEILGLINLFLDQINNLPVELDALPSIYAIVKNLLFYFGFGSVGEAIIKQTIKFLRNYIIDNEIIEIIDTIMNTLYHYIIENGCSYREIDKLKYEIASIKFRKLVKSHISLKSVRSMSYFVSKLISMLSNYDMHIFVKINITTFLINMFQGIGISARCLLSFKDMLKVLNYRKKKYIKDKYLG